MPLSIPELSTAVAIAVAIGGALFALSRQSSNQALVTGRDLQSQVDELKATNRYMVAELARLERENKIMGDKLSFVEEELRDWKRRYERQTAENDALTRALGAKQ